MLTAVAFFSLVSPEAVGFLSAVGVFIILMLLLFLYINKKFCFENVGGFPDLRSGYDARKNSQDKMCKYHIASSFFICTTLRIYNKRLDLTHNKLMFEPLVYNSSRSVK